MPDECRRCVAWVLYAPCTCQRECSSELCAAMDQKPSPTASGPTHYHACNLAICADRGVDEFRLLPPGGEVSTQWAVRFTELLGHASPYVQPYSSEHVAREYAAADWRPHRTGELVNRRVTTWPDGTELIGPWSPVVSDNTDERPQWAIRDHTGTYGVTTTVEREIRRSWAQGITWWDPDGTYELCRRDGASGTWEVVERHPVVSADGSEVDD